MKFLILIILSFFKFFSFSQGEANNWFFAYNSGISFATGVPVLLNGGAMSTDEGCATISDAAGNLLFYTDGVNVYNKNHLLMPNGTGLLGSPSSTQSGVIIKQPGNSTIYYIFTTPAPEDGYVNGLRYSEVDLSLDGGNGEVTNNKNILLQTPTCEKITGVRHANNQDVWLISHDTGSNQFRTFLITSAGINLTPIISNVGEIVIDDPVSFFVAGQLKAYLGGKKIASATYSSNTFELFDFDNATGLLSNPVLLSNTSVGAYGVEFSPDGSKLYGSIIIGSTLGQPLTENLYQWDLCAGTLSANDIINSRQLIFSGSASSQGMGSLQLAPDGKIYVARYNGLPPGDPNNTHFLGVINDPNASGLACNYVDDGLFLGAMTSGVGLPNFVPYNLDNVTPPILNFSYDSILCANNGIADPVFHPQFTAGGTFSCLDPNLILDANTGQINLNQTQIGTYFVKYDFIVSSCGIQSYDTTIQVKIENGIQVADFTLPNEMCVLGQNVLPVPVLNQTPGGIYSSQVGLIIDQNTGEIDLSLSAIGNYTVNYSVNQILCKQAVTASVQFNLLNSAIAIFTPAVDTILSLFQTSVSFNNFSTNANSYIWSFGDSSISFDENPTHTFPNEPGEYLVRLIAIQNESCNDTSFLRIKISENSVFYVPNAFTPNNDELNQIFKPIISNEIINDSYTLLIFDKWGEILFESHDKEIGWDGTYLTKMVQDGIYTWKITFLTIKSEEIQKSGHVLIFK